MKIEKTTTRAFRTLLLRSVIPLVALGGAGKALAQTPQIGAGVPPAGHKSAQIEEVVVTAQKRKEKLQNVPIAVTAISGAQLSAGGVSNVADLGKVAPGLLVNQAIGVYAEPVLRSVGTSSHGPGIENPVATYVDGVYFLAATSSLMSLFDIDQIAVLKGPQGTLFGRNATGGLIQITTKLPTQPFHADLEGTVGNVGTFNQGLYLNGGLTPTLAGNLAISHDDQDQSFGKNLYKNEYVGTFHDLAVRGKLRWQPDADTDVVLSADWSHHQGTDIVTRALGLTPDGVKEAGGYWDINDNITPSDTYHGGGVSLTVRRDFGVAQLVSITAYRVDDSHNDFDGNDQITPSVEINSTQTDDQFSQELQLLSPDSGRFTWSTGLYYLNGDSRANPGGVEFYANPFFSDYSKDYVNSRVNSAAAFAQATYKITPSTNITAGVRYTADFRSFAASQYDNFGGSVTNNVLTFAPGGFHFTAADTQNKTWAEPSARLSVDHRFSPELLVYASYNHGFRSGSFDPGGTPPVNAELHPEILDAFETGFKSDLFDRRLRFNAAGFLYEYQNRQVQSIYFGREFDYDAKRAQSYGADGDLTAYVTDQLSLNGGFSVIHATYTDFDDAFVTMANPACLPGNCANVNLVNPAGDATGKFVENTPFWTLNLTPTYRIPTPVGDLTLTASYYHSGGWYAGPDDRVKQTAYDTLAADVAFVPAFAPQLVIKVWGKNLTNTEYASQITESNSADNANVAPGRTYGLTLDAHF